jgi:hypothetical protein
MEIIYEGKTYVGKTSDKPEASAEIAAEKMFDNINTISKLKLPLEDGSILVIGNDVLTKSVFIFFPTSGAI